MIGDASESGAAWTRVRSPPERRSLPHLPAGLFITAAMLTAVIVGRFVADGRLKYGVAIVMAACYLPLVLFDLAAALAVFVAVQFFQDLSILSSGPNAMGVMVGLGWIGAALGHHGRIPAFREHRSLLTRVILFCGWATLSIAWSPRAGPAGNEAGYWWLAALAFLVALTTLRTAREIRYVALAFVAGSVVSVVIGVFTGSLHPTVTAVTQTAIQGRFTGGGGDPNVQAAGFVGTMFVSMGLLSVYRRGWLRRALLVAFALVTLGFFATQSRGGLLALIAAAIAAFAISPRDRRRILALAGIVGVAVTVLVATSPGALARITDFGGGSSGRSDLWRVGWQVFKGHVLVGVGAGNFTVVESHYTLSPGSISHIAYLTDVPFLVHNTYLQLLAETGVVGLVAYLAVLIGSIRAAWSAVQSFERLGQPNYADLARAVLMGVIGMSVALFFISDGDDLRFWVLLAMGPALATVARRESVAPG